MSLKEITKEAREFFKAARTLKRTIKEGIQDGLTPSERKLILDELAACTVELGELLGATQDTLSELARLIRSI
jgi:hypothetical protein